MSTAFGQNGKIDALIFDLDGVLIDVSNSYRQAIIQTVDCFFTVVLGMEHGGETTGPLLKNEDLDLLKQAGGFNNDWDVTTAFIIYFLEMLPRQRIITHPMKLDTAGILSYLQATTHNLTTTLDQLRARKNIRRLARGLADMGGGLKAVKMLLKHRNRHLLAAHGSLLEGNLVQRIFQELYLGERLFEATYHTPPIVVHQPGLIDDETLMIEPETLEKLAQRYRLGIATGRPRSEAEYALRRLKIASHFEALVTHDDVVAAGAQGKPDPWSLLEAARRIQPQPRRCAYIGDTPDDIRAAKKAHETISFMAIGVLAAAANRAALRDHFEQCQADVILNHPQQLKDLLLQ